MRIRRCYSCGLRFTRLRSSVIFVQDADKVLRKLAFLGLIVAGLALTILLMAWASAVSSAPSA